MRQHASELVQKVKSETEGKEYMIDRRMINTFLVQYLNPKSDDGTRQHMLDAMSKILAFTMEEKQTLGLVQKETVDGKAADSVQKKGLGGSLISFLMGDDDFE